MSLISLDVIHSEERRVPSSRLQNQHTQSWPTGHCMQLRMLKMLSKSLNWWNSLVLKHITESKDVPIMAQSVSGIEEK